MRKNNKRGSRGLRKLKKRLTFSQKKRRHNKMSKRGFVKNLHRALQMIQVTS